MLQFSVKMFRTNVKCEDTTKRFFNFLKKIECILEKGDNKQEI